MTNDKLAVIATDLRRFADIHENLYNDHNNVTRSPAATGVRLIAKDIEKLEEYYPPEYPVSIMELDALEVGTPILIVGNAGRNIVGIKRLDDKWELSGWDHTTTAAVLISALESDACSMIVVLPVPVQL